MAGGALAAVPAPAFAAGLAEAGQPQGVVGLAQIFAESTGAVVAGFPKAGNSIWAGFGGGCQVPCADQRGNIVVTAGMVEFPEIHQKVLVERNRRWLPEIEKSLEQASEALIVVGAAHLVGSDGIIEMLKTKGYSVEQK